MGNPAGLGIYAGVGKGKKPKRSYIQSIKKYGKRGSVLSHFKGKYSETKKLQSS